MSNIFQYQTLDAKIVSITYTLYADIDASNKKSIAIISDDSLKMEPENFSHMDPAAMIKDD